MALQDYVIAAMKALHHLPSLVSVVSCSFVLFCFVCACPFVHVRFEVVLQVFTELRMRIGESEEELGR